MSSEHELDSALLHTLVQLAPVSPSTHSTPNSPGKQSGSAELAGGAADGLQAGNLTVAEVTERTAINRQKSARGWVG